MNNLRTRDPIFNCGTGRAPKQTEWFSKVVAVFYNKSPAPGQDDGQQGKRLYTEELKYYFKEVIREQYAVDGRIPHIAVTCPLYSPLNYKDTTAGQEGSGTRDRYVEPRWPSFKSRRVAALEEDYDRHCG